MAREVLRWQHTCHVSRIPTDGRQRTKVAPSAPHCRHINQGFCDRSVSMAHTCIEPENIIERQNKNSLPHQQEFPATSARILHHISKNSVPHHQASKSARLILQSIKVEVQFSISQFYQGDKIKASSL